MLLCGSECTQLECETLPAQLQFGVPMLHQAVVFARQHRFWPQWPHTHKQAILCVLIGDTSNNRMALYLECENAKGNEVVAM